MTAPDLTAIVEAVARATYEAHPIKLQGDVMAWEDIPEFVRFTSKESALPAVTATLRALAPLADGWEALAKGDVAEALKADDVIDTMKHAAHAVGRNACANELRALIAGAK